MGATPDGQKELVAVVDGYRESEQSWYELLIDLKTRGLSLAPKLAIGDGALGFWAAGYWSRSATLLVAFVGAMALLRGINEIVLAFRLHEAQSTAAMLS